MRRNFIKILICCSFLLLSFQGCKEEFSPLEEKGISQKMVEKLNKTCGTSGLPWLEEIIVKADEDDRSGTYQGNFMGTVYLEDYQNEPVIFVRMAMGSGGLYGYAYRCDGSRVDFDNDPNQVESFFSKMKRNQIIYTNVPAVNED